eukprot:TRINITY_DN5408_c0_g1_i1.p1 TRINITY_DN5408_c0_g1~~TRINITY_DN5408_c0_g1_i1.p1  ORF type:complete len:1233 (-),score=257.63 TRINITY_DN5408_c0_g1_i1:1839-5537(-)
MGRPLGGRIKAAIFGTPPLPAFRTIHVNSHEANAQYQYIDNHVSTTKYQWYSYLPKALWEQFRRVANLYFLFHALLSLTPITPVSPVSTVLPLVFVVGLAMLKELWEDIQRGRSDGEINNRKVEVVTPGGLLVSKTWKEVRVGDIVKVEGDTFFPADLVCLGTSDPEGGCYVETMNLDGETNLKPRRALEHISSYGPQELGEMTSTIECEQPNLSIYTFVGNLLSSNKGDGYEQVPQHNGLANHLPASLNISPDNVLLRGSCLRNTPYIFGVAVFTGFDSKIVMNSTDPPSKRSVVERRLDLIVLFQLGVLVVLSLITGIGFAILLHNDMPLQWYLNPGNTKGTNTISSAQFNWRNPAVAGLLQFFTSLILYGYFVPISLYVSIEIVKLFQSRFISNDLGMYYAEKDVPTKARTSNLNEELGMIKTILSDKTGTLTRNQMDFFKCSIAGVSYGTGATEVERAAALRAGVQLSAEAKVQVAELPLEKGYNMKDSRLDALAWMSQPGADTIRRFLEVLSVCHTVVCEGPEEPDTIKYLAESPDEAAFVVAAKRLGYFFHKRQGNAVTVRVSGKDAGGEGVQEMRCTVLNTIAFTSARKRMSVVVRAPDGALLLLCKGADNVIIDRLSSAPEAHQFRAATQDHMREYAEAGLRTLAIAWKPLEEGVYDDWQRRWVAAKAEVSTAAAQAEKLDELGDELEKGLFLLGATAIEDKLQVGVPETIDRLAQAGIKLWVLTGDKLETAINIGFACSLLRLNMAQHLVYLEDRQEELTTGAAKEGSTLEEFSESLIKRQINEASAAIDAALASSFHTLQSQALIIDGKALAVVLADPAIQQRFLQMALRCESVICCRVSPKQKAVVTEMVRMQGNQVTLGVGDGANDVGMIQKANIGVGISGEEGQQAVMASDFSIGQFRFLERLLLVHGGWCYRRIAFMVCFFFYKNFVFGFSIFFYNAVARFSGQSIYYDWYLSLYNVIFSAFPVCVMAILDQDVSAAYRLRFPLLYHEGQENQAFRWKRIGLWLLTGFYQACAIFAVVIASYWLPPDRSNGQMVDYLLIGTTMFSAVVLSVNIMFVNCCQYWTWIHHVVIWGEIFLWFFFALVGGALPAKLAGPAKGLMLIMLQAPSFYLVLVLAVVIALLPDFFLRAINRNRFPSDHHIIQEREKMERVKRQRFWRKGPRAEEPSGAAAEEASLQARVWGGEWTEEEIEAQRGEAEQVGATMLQLKAESFRDSRAGP